MMKYNFCNQNKCKGPLFQNVYPVYPESMNFTCGSHLASQIYNFKVEQNKIIFLK